MPRLPSATTTTSLARFAALALVGAGVAFGGPAHAGPKRELPEKFRKSPYTIMSVSVGHPNDGYQLRAKRLKKSPHLKILKKATDRSYGHPALVLMLQRSAKDVARAKPGSVLVVGDLSSEHGGPLSGHRSHQSGRDADIAFYARDAKGKPVVLDRYVAFDGNGRAKDGSGLVFDDERNWMLVSSWARDDRAGLAYIFLSNPLRARLVAHANRSPARKKVLPKVLGLFKQPENAEPHDDHFHVRIRCPDKQEGLCMEHPK